jgi:hypothetical protein
MSMQGSDNRKNAWSGQSAGFCPNRKAFVNENSGLPLKKVTGAKSRAVGVGHREGVCCREIGFADQMGSLRGLWSIEAT